MIKKYIKKPVIIEAVQWNGHNCTEVATFVAGTKRTFGFSGDSCIIETLEGTMIASKGDYIIKGIKGEFYPCKPDIFQATYEECEV